MKRFAMGLAAVTLVAGAAQADDSYPYSVFLHFTQPSFAGCDETVGGFMQDALLNCGVIDTGASDYGSFSPNFLWILVGNVPDGTGPGAPGGIGGLQFGIEYDATVALGGGFSLCTGGSAIPQDDLQGSWPQSGTGNAVTWGGGCGLVTDNEDGVTTVGFIPIAPGSSGIFSIIGDPRIDGIVEAADCDTNPTRVCTQALGSADATVGGTGGESTCGIKCATPVAETTWGSLKSMY